MLDDKKFVIGVDFGSLSSRAVLVNALTGEILTSAVKEYPHKIMYETLPSGVKLPSLFALQHPNDYIECLRSVINECFEKTNTKKEQVKAICVDFTSCTILPCKKDGTPLCVLDKFKDNPHAYVKLWKHHSAQFEADCITETCTNNDISLIREGGKISSEMLFPKVLETINKAPEVFDETDYFLEAGDWISLLLTGKRTNSISFLAYKGLWNEKTGFLPDNMLEKISPLLTDNAGGKLSPIASPLGVSVGTVNKKGAELFSLNEGTIVATPIIDSHASVPSLSVTEDKNFLMILGTSSAFILNTKEEKRVDGITGLGYESSVPNYYSYESAQASVGDTFEWFTNNALPSSYYENAKKENKKIHQYLREKAEKLKVGESGLIFLDWLNGNRSTLTDARLTGALIGLNLNTKPEEIYRALIEGTAFGARVIFENFIKNGVTIEKVTATGGIAQKDPMLMQIYADVLNREIFVPKVEFSASLGSAIYASVACGIYKDLQSATKVFSIKDGVTYKPIKENVLVYDKLFNIYYSLYSHFGKNSTIMKDLLNIKENTK